jgi:hypothetical protein
MISRRLHLSLTLALLAIGCGDPVTDDQVAALPDEVPGVALSEFHRPGQPCLLCHGPYGGKSPEMSIAGTIFATPQQGKKPPTPVGGVIVTITDAFGDVKTKKTNCIGNFYFTADEWQPGFPLAAKIEYPDVGGGKGTTPAYMSTRIGREGSCAGCHRGPRAEDTPGSVFCVDQDTDPFPAPGKDCQGVP